MKIYRDKKILGLSLLEALVSTAIVGIGFVAILQMTNYSVQSIYTSGERTKANYLTNMIAEDVVGNQELSTTSDKNFSEYLASNPVNLDFCNAGTNTSVSYTHLRAHETSQDLVCRLLLEKKKIATKVAGHSW